MFSNVLSIFIISDSKDRSSFSLVVIFLKNNLKFRYFNGLFLTKNTGLYQK